MSAPRDERGRPATQAPRPGMRRRWFERFGWLAERILGYLPAGRWRLYPTSRIDRRRGALPAWIPVPAGETEAWAQLGREGRVPFARLAGYAADFLREKPNHPLAAELRRFVAKAPLADKVEAALRGQRCAEAEEFLQQILEIDAEDARARMLLGSCALLLGNLEEAAGSFEEVAGILQEDPEFQVLYGSYWEARGDAEQAKARYHRALELEPGHAAAMERLSALGEMVEIYLGTLEDPERAFLPVEEYEKLIEKGWLQEPHDAAFFLERSHFHLRHGQGGLARKAAGHAMERLDAPGPEAGPPPPRIEVLAAACRAELALGHLDLARSKHAEMERTDAGSVWTVSCRAHLLWSGGDRAGAAQAVLEAIDLDSNRIEDLLLFLDPAYPGRTGDPVAALKSIEKKYPQSHAIKSLMASVFMAKGEWPEGVGLAVAAARLGASPESLVELTGRLGREGRDEDVHKVAEAAGGWKRLLGRDPVLCSNLAASYQRRGETAAARELWRSVRDDEQAHPTLRLRAKDALSRLGPAEG